MAAVPSLPVQTDADAQETQEWLDALGAVIQQEGPERAHYLIEKQIELARGPGQLGFVFFGRARQQVVVQLDPRRRQVKHIEGGKANLLLHNKKLLH